MGLVFSISNFFINKNFFKTEIEKESVLFLQTDYLPCEFLLIKKLEIEETKTTFIISVLKVVYLLGGLSFFEIQLFFTHKNSQGRKLSAE